MGSEIWLLCRQSEEGFNTVVETWWRELDQKVIEDYIRNRRYPWMSPLTEEDFNIKTNKLLSGDVVRIYYDDLWLQKSEEGIPI